MVNCESSFKYGRKTQNQKEYTFVYKEYVVVYWCRNTRQTNMKKKNYIKKDIKNI